MSRAILILALLALAGCQTMERYPRTTAFVAGSLALSAGIAIHQRRDRSEPEPRMSTPLVDCSTGACK